MVKLWSYLKPAVIYMVVSCTVFCWVTLSLRCEVGELNVTVNNENDAQNYKKIRPSVCKKKIIEFSFNVGWKIAKRHSVRLWIVYL